MKNYYGLLGKIADEYDIKQGINERENDCKARIIYSFLGMTGYSALWDISEDDYEDEIISIDHFKQRILTTMNNLLDMYCDVDSIITNRPALSDEIYNVMHNAGCFYHKRRRISPPIYAVSRAEKCTYIRGQALGERVSISGLGCYRLSGQEESAENFLTLHEMFGLHEDTLSDFWHLLTQDTSWAESANTDLFEHLRLSPPFTAGYWQKEHAPEGVISLARTVQASGCQYFLCRTEGNSMYLSRLPEWLDHRIAASACLANNNTLPPITYHSDGAIITMRLGYILPNAEMNIIRLYSWPSIYTKFPAYFTRIIDAQVFRGIMSTLSTKGYTFREV